MKQRITTKNGSVYLLDHQQKTWERIEGTDASGKLRTFSGAFLKVSTPCIGEGLLLECPPLDPQQATQRFVYTSNVTEIKDDQ